MRHENESPSIHDLHTVSSTDARNEEIGSSRKTLGQGFNSRERKLEDFPCNAVRKRFQEQRVDEEEFCSTPKQREKDFNMFATWTSQVIDNDSSSREQGNLEFRST